jgi:uncharacterized protein
MPVAKKDIKCPTCGKANTWTEENASRPFCSPRCKLIDLGDWADEKHRIAGDAEDEISSEKNDDNDK